MSLSKGNSPARYNSMSCGTNGWDRTALDDGGDADRSRNGEGQVDVRERFRVRRRQQDRVTPVPEGREHPVDDRGVPRGVDRVIHSSLRDLGKGRGGVHLSSVDRVGRTEITRELQPAFDDVDGDDPLHARDASAQNRRHSDGARAVHHERGILARLEDVEHGACPGLDAAPEQHKIWSGMSSGTFDDAPRCHVGDRGERRLAEEV